MKDFFKAPRLTKDDVGELVFCLVTICLVFGFSRRLPSLTLTEEELLLTSLVFATFVGVWGCFFYLATINKRLKGSSGTPEQIS